jgi:hypothetical protein
MKRIFIFALLLLPGMAFAVVCKTVGTDGVVSFTNVPGSECPPGATATEYAAPAPAAERIRAVETGISGRELNAERYRAIRITEPAEGGTVRSTGGTFMVKVELQPRLQSGHFITVYLDGRAYRGRYGSSDVELTGLERGSHQLRAEVSDSKGRVLITSETVTFTAQQIRPQVVVDPITSDDYLDTTEAGTEVTVTGRLTGTLTGTATDRPEIRLRFPVSGWISPPAQLNEDGTWEVKVPGELLAAEASFEAVARITPDPAKPEASFEYKTTSTHSVDPRAFKGFYGAKPDANYSADPKAGEAYTPSGGGISTTPGQTNPAFTPNYRP